MNQSLNEIRQLKRGLVRNENPGRGCSDNDPTKAVTGFIRGGGSADTGRLRPPRSMPASRQIVPHLAGRGLHLASESMFYQVLRQHNEVPHSGCSRRAQRYPCRSPSWLQSPVRSGPGTSTGPLLWCGDAGTIC